MSIIVFSSPMIALAYSYSQVFENMPPATLNWACPLSGWPTVTSSWNTPRDVGTNPHRGVDLSANFVPIYAVWNGWLTQVGLYTIRFQIDINNDGIKNDSVYYCEYYHLSARSSEGYYTKGAQIGTSGNEGGAYDPHLHFGGASSDIRWYRNEINYRWTSYWCNGEDLDSFKWVEWNNNNTAAITIYFMDDPYTYISPSEVGIFHRKAGTQHGQMAAQ
ncbi:MAG: M23 family metallopeptidase [Bacteroidales bacterium]|nr:M23 family metallopeptidase [Bacteroidales bacterium]